MGQGPFPGANQYPLTEIFGAVFDTNDVALVVKGLLNTGLNLPVYDSLTYTATNPTTDTYLFYTGGLSGTLVATLTIVYTDSTHATLVSAART
jgi:hypothetical protein